MIVANDSYLFIRMPSEVKKALDGKASKEGQSTSVFVRALIHKALKKG